MANLHNHIPSENIITDTLHVIIQVFRKYCINYAGILVYLKYLTASHHETILPRNWPISAPCTSYDCPLIEVWLSESFYIGAGNIAFFMLMKNELGQMKFFTLKWIRHFFKLYLWREV